MELFTSLILSITAIALGVGLIVYALRGRQSQARAPRKFRGRP